MSAIETPVTPSKISYNLDFNQLIGKIPIIAYKDTGALDRPTSIHKSARIYDTRKYPARLAFSKKHMF